MPGSDSGRLSYPFKPQTGVAGDTKFTWTQLFRLAFTGLTSFTVVPLRLVSLAGLLLSVIALALWLYLLFEHYVQGDHLPGWATLSVGMMFLSGVQLLALGVIAEYLGRTFEEVKQRPILHRRGGQPPKRPAPTRLARLRCDADDDADARRPETPAIQ